MRNYSGEKVKAKMYIHVYGGGTMEPCLLASDMTEYGYILLGTVDVEVTIPNCNPIEKAVESIEKQIEKERADHHVKITALQEKMQNLLAIGHDGEKQ